jgi:hypothetical protein
MRAVLAAADQVAPVSPTRVGIDETVMTTGRLTTAVGSSSPRWCAWTPRWSSRSPRAATGLCDRVCWPITPPTRPWWRAICSPGSSPPPTPSRTRSWSPTCSTCPARAAGAGRGPPSPPAADPRPPRPQGRPAVQAPPGAARRPGTPRRGRARQDLRPAPRRDTDDEVAARLGRGGPAAHGCTSPRPRHRPPAAGRLLRVGRRGRRRRGHPARHDHRHLAGRGARVLRHPRLERPHRVREREDQVDPPGGPRVPQLRQLRRPHPLHAGQPRRVPTTTRIRPYSFATAA